jgi:hypothetical protein
MILSDELDEPVSSSHYLPTARPCNLKTMLTVLGQRYARSPIWERPLALRRHMQRSSAPIVPDGWRGFSLTFNCESVSILLRATHKPERA